MFDELIDDSLLDRMTRSFETYKKIHPMGIQKLTNKDFYLWRRWIAT